jgi:hypothetical protein
VQDHTFPVSTLRVEPNRIRPGIKDYYGPEGGYVFWRLFVDDEVLTETAQPFQPSDPIIELSGNLSVPIYSDGDSYVSVRSLGHYVIWCRVFDDDMIHVGRPWVDLPGLPDDRIFAFDASNYASSVMSAYSMLEGDDSQTQYRKLNEDIKNDRFSSFGASRTGVVYSRPAVTESGANPKQTIMSRLMRFLSLPRENDTIEVQPSASVPVRSALPELSQDEFRWLMARQLPDATLPLYRTPERPDDPRGWRLLWQGKAVVDGWDTEYVASPPQDWIELRIGLDLPPEFPECVWRIGRAENGLALLFVSKPCFPVWICGEVVNRAFNAESRS